ncbi:MAG: hypothetical protein K2L55_07185 [Muribaculaceae bacterium]|nr:hypothetical protein [Muribaculaceae bacterium]
MIKEIKYNGYTAVPSDYECPDGDLALSLNLINEDEHIVAINLPKTILNLQPEEKVICIHSVTGQKNYILLRGNTDLSFELFWLEKNDDIVDTEAAKHIATMEELLDVSPLGNILIFALKTGLKYIIWRDGNYSLLGARPPFISIDFGMSFVGYAVEHKDYNLPAMCAPAYPRPRKVTDAQLSELTQAIYGLLNPVVTEKIISRGYFYQPFFVRYAYRLYDGTHSWHSAPILMLPNVMPPWIGYADDGSAATASGDGTITATFTTRVPYFSLDYRILSDGIEELKKWTDLVVGIDIFVSAPIYTYDQSKDLTGTGITNYRSMLLQFWRQSIESRRGDEVPDRIFTGHYADLLDGQYIDHHASASGDAATTYIVDIKPHERFHENVRDAHEFYKIGEIKIDSLNAMASMSPLKMVDKDMAALVAKETLSDDYQSHCNIIASSLYSYNSRLNLAGIKISPAEPYSLRSCTQFSNPDDGPAAAKVRITVWTRINGVLSYAVHEGGLESDIFHNPDNNFPRYIYYPDASAYKMEIYISETQKFIIDLTPHDFLNGAYFYNNNFDSDGLFENAAPVTVECAEAVVIANKIYTSDINNPFYFPILGINTIGSGEILGLSTAAKALSQGQFGQFPLYAFTTEGVWALELSVAGTFIARQPITRDVCINPGAITQIDSGVIFPTDRGLMLISGSQTQCISEPINSITPVTLLDLPQFGEHLLSKFTPTDPVDDRLMPLPPLTSLLKDCGMTYDYINQRIVLFFPNLPYSYIFSLKSQSWGMMYATFKRALNSYPDALAVSLDNKIVDLSRPADATAPVRGLLVSRPLKLDAADILKTVDTVIQRGNFHKGHVQSVLYGSRDLHSWHLVWSSKDHYLRGFRGTPYKYFRIAVIATLNAYESIYGASVQFTPRLTNQPR